MDEGKVKNLINSQGSDPSVSMRVIQSLFNFNRVEVVESRFC